MADIDLTQYNGTPVFPTTADVGTNADPYLTPTDGKIITATSNAANQAPVNRSIYRIKDLLLGLRGALVGDFAGAVQKTVRSFFADGTGGNTHTVPAGTIQAQEDLISVNGDITCSNGQIFCDPVGAGTGLIKGGIADFLLFLRAGTAATQQTILSPPRLRWLITGTGANDANPPLGTSLKNDLRAINVPKVAGFVDTNGGTPIVEGFGFSVTVSNQTLSNGIGGTFTIPVIKVTFTDAFDNANYQVTTCGFDNMTLHIDKATRTTTFFYLYARDASGNFPSAAAGTGWTGGFSVFGKQTT